MYTLVSAIGEPLGGDSRWQEVTIGELPMRQLYDTYSNVLAVLSNPFLSVNVSLDLSLIRAQWGTSELTFNQMLAALGNATLPTSTQIPQLSTKYARYADAFHAGYHATPVHPTAAADAQLPMSERTWLKLTRPNTDYQLFLKSCMVSINGLYHFLDADATGVYVKEANKSRLASGHNNIGILSFRELGELSYIALSPENIYLQADTQALRYRAYVNLPGLDLSNKTLIVVLGGYMHLLDNRTIFRTSDSSFGIDMENMPLFERYLESRQYMDLSMLPLERTDRNDTQFGVSDFLGDTNLRAYLTLAQSFVVVLDNTNIYTERLPVHTTRMPGMFISAHPPKYPLVLGYGKHANYWATYEDTQYSLNTVERMRDRYVFHTVDAKSENSLSDARTPGHRYAPHDAHFLRIGRDI